MTKSLQETYAAQSICYGCGPANSQGLQIKSFVEGDKVIAHWQPQAQHQAFPSVLNGGVIGTLLDCHCNWAASWFLMQQQQLAQPPTTVTAKYTIKLLRPTPVSTPLRLEATLEHIAEHKVTVHGKLFAQDKLCDTCEGVFVAVPPEHPAYHRW